MNTDLLREFITFAECLNVTVAAKMLHISQPTLSRHIADLEADLGCDLVTHGSEIGLTYAGETLLGEASQLLRCENNLRAAVESASKKKSMKLRIEYYPYMSPVTDATNLALNHLQDQNPDAHFDVEFIHPKKQHGIIECVLNGYFDIAILAHTGIEDESFVEEEGIGVYPLQPLRSKICFFVSKEHPLASQETISIRDLDGMQVLFPVNLEFRNFRGDMRALFERFGVDPIEVPCRVNSMADFAHGDLGSRIHVLTEADLTVENSPYLTNPNCKVLRCSDNAASVPYFLYRENTDNEAVQEFLGAIAKVLKVKEG